MRSIAPAKWTTTEAKKHPKSRLKTVILIVFGNVIVIEDVIVIALVSVIKNVIMIGEPARGFGHTGDTY